MTEQKAKKRAWVKTAAIVFLSIMLVLTLFSNMIFNASVPEVATQYISSGSVTTRIRGVGTATAVENYEITMDQTREVQSVLVRLGDIVEPGDTIFRFADIESSELKEAQRTLDDLELQYQTKLINIGGESYERENADIQRAREDLQTAKDNRDASYVSDEDITNAKLIVEQTKNEISSTEREILTLEAELAIAQGNGENIEWIARSLDEAQAKLREAQDKLPGLELAVTELEGKKNSWDAANEQVKAYQRTLEDLIIQLNETKKNAGKNQAIEALNMEALQKQITEQKGKIAQLQENAEGMTIESKVHGIVTAINVSPGNMAGGGQPMAVIEVVDRGYILTFPVNNEQAKKVNIGDKAEVINWYWGAQIDATLESIKNNPDSPGQGKILTFILSGDVESGSQLQLSVGQRSMDYETIVPNSAIREDSNGTFVLTVVAKNTALFNRYVATRVPVTVLAQDDTNAAVEGGLSYNDSVITTSTKPLENGMNVRLAGD